MPHVNIWIRKEDWKKWVAVENKAEWLHAMLNSDVVEYCKHGQVKGKCLQKDNTDCNKLTSKEE